MGDIHKQFGFIDLSFAFIRGNFDSKETYLGNSQSIKHENRAELSRDDAILIILKNFHHNRMIAHIDTMS